jgi:phosphoesterase RecJ-like protein
MILVNFKENINRLHDLLSSSQRIVLTTHHNPDGDALGSLLGMYFILRKMGTEPRMVIPNGFPDFLTWMPGSKEIILFSKQKVDAKRIINDADLLFALDYNGAKRLEDMEQLFRNAKGKKVLIDHHPNPDDDFVLQFSDTSVSSTAELVYEIGSALIGEQQIGTDESVNIFTGIMTDTGSFSYAISNPRTFDIIGKLIGNGVQLEEVQRQVYNTFSEGRLRLMGYSISEKMRVFPEYKAAYISLSREELKRFNYSIGDTEGLVNIPLSIKGIVFSALFVENTSFVKVSLRSRGSFSVNKFSNENYNGGGHTNAAGGKSFTTLTETEKVFETLLIKYSEELNQ